MGSWYDQEIMKELTKNGLIDRVKVLPSVKNQVDIIGKNYMFDGSKIDWNQTSYHRHEVSSDKTLLEDSRKFVQVFFSKHVFEKEVVTYLGDNLTEYGYQFVAEDSDILLGYFLEVPQHHYFSDLNGDWCICMSLEGDLDAGFRK